MVNTSDPSRVAMTLVVRVASLLLAVLSLTAASAASVAAVEQSKPRPDPAGHMADLLYSSDSGLDAVRLAPRSPTPAGPPTTIDPSPDYPAIALGGLGGVAIAAAVAGTLRGRRRRPTVLEAALAAGEPDEMSRAAGLLGDRLVEHSRADAAAHAYRAAVDLGHEYWSPIAQVALARLLSDQGDRIQARKLMEAVVASGHPRAVPVAEAGLGELAFGNRGGMADSAPDQSRWERLTDSADRPDSAG